MHVGGDLIALSFKAPSFLSFRFLLVFPPIALPSPSVKEEKEPEETDRGNAWRNCCKMSMNNIKNNMK